MRSADLGLASRDPRWRSSLVSGMLAIVAIVASLVGPSAVLAADPLVVVTESTGAQLRSETSTGRVVVEQRIRLIVSGGVAPYDVMWAMPTPDDGGPYGPQDWPTGVEFGLEAAFACADLPSTAEATVVDADGTQVRSETFVLAACPTNIPTAAFLLDPTTIGAGEPVTVTSLVRHLSALDQCFFVLAQVGGSAEVLTPAPVGGACPSVAFHPPASGVYDFQALIAGIAENGLPAYVTANQDVTLTVEGGGGGSDIAFSELEPPVDGGDVVNLVRRGRTVPIKFAAFDGDTEIVDPSAVTVSSTQVSCPASPVTDTVEVTSSEQSGLGYDARDHHFIYHWRAPSGPAGSCWDVSFTIEGSTLTAHFRLT